MEPEANSTSVLQRIAGVKLLVLGGGYSGHRLAQTAARHGINGLITVRDPGAAAPAPPGWQLLGFDSTSGAHPDPGALEGVSHVLSTIPPQPDGSDPVLTGLGELLRAMAPQWVGYLSTTGVYGNSHGAWVDEQSPCRPTAGRSQARLRCERAWQASGLPLQIFRLPAIYGPGRTPFADLRAGRSRLLHRRGQVFCRIHVDDLCGAVLHCLAQPPDRRPPVINVSDHEPCPASEPLGYAAHLLGCKLPEVRSFAAASDQMSAMARSFWQDNRRVSNALLCSQLGYRLRYPSYREGLRAALAEEGGQSPG